MGTSFISLNDLKRNFAEVKAGMKPKEAIEESNRCLYCYDAPCVRACPTGIEIPSFIKKIASGNLKGSSRVIMEANPVGATCSRVCPTEELCEGACVLNQSSKPILIGQLQRYATDWAMKNEAVLFKPGASLGKSVAIIGSGPAGLSAARELARFGFQVTVYEAKEQAGGLDTYGIVSFRLPQEISLWEVDQIRQLGVDFKLNTRVGVDITAESLLENYDVIVLAVGMSKVPMLGIEGEDLTGVYDAIDFVEATKSAADLDTNLIGKRVAVIGAGNTAIDAATCSVRLGAEQVQIVYRRTQAEMTAYDFEFDFAKMDGVAFRWLTAPSRIIGDANGNVTALECILMELIDDEAGRRRPVPVVGSEFILPVDAVIKAIGQTRHASLIDQFKLAHIRGTVTVNPETGQTSNPKVFAAGDVIFGEGQGEAMVVSAAQQGKQAAYAIYKQVTTAQNESA
ncbi:NAD(P)-dependent oxidoreductase [Paenibacillus chondroitinus]|uniref:NAD(P)-dependent oxidoreductase n=1 Tax=Paenibacillus chondroitinus TaxID=59842 RepID=A0ABU6DND5_9BACL|nr:MULTISPECIES: NAD(P)-dependent oxidoreductase [Paenibacillus]MCY9660584.1 NAD(P)-dependent oxidoreductase [Paenibacillus anseongense]MEB4799302.1 NAD(P)-dependent oxidoreductase [Paenibacillus chondroitinus]